MGMPQMWHGLPSALSLALSFLLALPLALRGFTFPIPGLLLNRIALQARPCGHQPA